MIARRASVGTVFFASAILLTACGASPPRRMDESTLAGCYALARLDSPSVALGALMPDTVQLDSAVQMNNRGEPNPRFPRRLRMVSHRPGADSMKLDLGDGATAPWPPDWERAFAFTGWRLDRPDTVTANLHQNMGPSWTLRFRPAGDSLVGSAEYYDDSPATRTIPIAAHRVPCRGNGREPVTTAPAR